MDMQIILLTTTMLALAIVGIALLKISGRINQSTNSDNESIIKAFREESERIEKAFRYEIDTVRKEAEERGQRLRQEVGTMPTPKCYCPSMQNSPQEDFERLMYAIENADRQAIESAQKSLEMRIKDEARRISSKYIQPPRTTDFAILFLPTEGLFAEAIRMPRLVS